MKTLKTLACGTVRAGRKGLPGDIMNIKDNEIKSTKRGQCVFRQKGRLTACTWKDNKFVHLLTTMPATSECSTVTRAVKDKGKWVQKEVQRPAIVELYNKFMGGVDLADQRVRSVDTQYACSVCHIRMCPAPCFQRFHTLENYFYDDEDRGDADVVRGTRRGRPRNRARGCLSL